MRESIFLVEGFTVNLFGLLSLKSMANLYKNTITKLKQIDYTKELSTLPTYSILYSRSRVFTLK
jgi:hypothetical protein